MTDLEAAARRIVELGQKAEAYPGISHSEDKERYKLWRSTAPALAADWLRLREVEKAARALIDAPGGQFLLEQDPDVGVMADPEARALESALAALDQHRKETK